MTHFQPELFAFLAELKENNTKEWFQANKERYRSDVQEPLIGFISAFAEPLRSISPNFVADTSQPAACKRGFLDVYVERCRAASPLMRFLTESVGLEF